MSALGDLIAIISRKSSRSSSKGYTGGIYHVDSNGSVQKDRKSMETGQIKLIKEQEMVCMNSILGGGKIQGIKLKLPFFYKEQYYIKSTMEQMYEDGLFDPYGGIN